MGFYYNTNSFYFEFLFYKRIKKFKFLLVRLLNNSGRSNLGRLIILNRNRSLKKYYRLIDFKRLLYNVPMLIKQFEFDCNRSTFIMLIIYLNGIISYLLAINLVFKYKILYSICDVDFLSKGNALFCGYLLVGSYLCCCKLLKNADAKFARSAGTYIQLVRKMGSYVLIRLPSKEERFIFFQNVCTFGRLTNRLFKLMSKCSAGQNRRYGRKMHVRGTAKNPIDHPHGGGAARTSAGRPSVSLWGWYTKGIRTTTRFIRMNNLSFGFFKRRTKEVW